MYPVSSAAAAAVLFTCAGAIAQSTVLEVPSVYPTIQSAINAASTGDSVLVAPGSYNEAINFLGKEIIVESSGGSENTTIDGDGLTVSIVTCTSGETAASVLRGFTLLRGSSGTEVGSPPAFAGGGAYVESASPTFEDIVFQQCESGYGGGLYALRSDSVLTNCKFNRCVANSNSGAAQVFYNGVTFENCDFVENFCVGYGGAVHAIQGNHVFSNCNFSLNGGPYWDQSVTWCNYGGAISWWTWEAGARLTISNCSLEDNRASEAGGGLWVKPGFDSVDLSNSTICLNSEKNLFGRYTDLGGNTVCDCEGDFTGDGAVGGGDLSILLGYWGQCQEEDCIADLNFDGVINGADLTLLIGKWGPCSY